MYPEIYGDGVIENKVEIESFLDYREVERYGFRQEIGVEAKIVGQYHSCFQF